MRATIVLDDDVASVVDLLCRERSLGLSQAVNELIRRGLAQSDPEPLFVQRASHMGLRIDVTNMGEALETLDGPFYR